MIKLSILIPTYEQECYRLVEKLHRQAEQIADMEYEIIVSDDATTTSQIKGVNAKVSTLSNCRLITQQRNIGRSANRNLLAKTASHPWLLFIDSHMNVKDERFLQRYCEVAEHDVVYYGGYVIPEKFTVEFKHNLRAKYERHCMSKQTLEVRQQRPYDNFHTANFMIPRKTALQFLFNETITQYGYEDVLYGITLQQNNIPIVHIDNPALFDTFESNERFLAKTEQAMQTLRNNHMHMFEYSALLRCHQRCRRLHITPVLSLWHRLFVKMEKKNLCGKHPSVTLFQLYKLGLYNQLSEK